MNLSHLIHSIPTDQLHTLEHLGQNMFWEENNPDVRGISSAALIMMIYWCRVGVGIVGVFIKMNSCLLASPPNPEFLHPSPLNWLRKVSTSRWRWNPAPLCQQMCGVSPAPAVLRIPDLGFFLICLPQSLHFLTQSVCVLAEWNYRWSLLWPFIYSDKA